MTGPIKPVEQNSWEISTRSKFKDPGIEAIPTSAAPGTIDVSSLLAALNNSSSGSPSIGTNTPTGITDQDFFNAITVTFSPGTAPGPYGTLVGTGSTGQTIDVTVTLPDINGIIDYKINVVKV